MDINFSTGWLQAGIMRECAKLLILVFFIFIRICQTFYVMGQWESPNDLKMLFFFIIIMQGNKGLLWHFHTCVLLMYPPGSPVSYSVSFLVCWSSFFKPSFALSFHLFCFPLVSSSSLDLVISLISPRTHSSSLVTFSRSNSFFLQTEKPPVILHTETKLHKSGKIK